MYRSYVFHKDNELIYSDWVTSQNSYYRHHIPSLDFTSAGAYTCEYWDSRSTSPRSNLISILVTDYPPSPSISLSPSRSVYIRGESVTVTCSFPGGSAVTGIRFYREGKEIPREKTPGRGATYVISTSAQEAAGRYTCGYWVETYGRRILSFLSNEVMIRISESITATSFSRTSQLPTTDNEVQPKSTSPVTYTSSDPTEAPTISLTSTKILFQTSKVPTTAPFTSLTPTLPHDWKRTQSTWTQHHNTSVVNTAATSHTWIYYTIGGSLFLLLMCILIPLLLRRTRTFRKWKRPAAEPAHITVPLLEQKTMEEQHLYSEINPFPPADCPPLKKLNSSSRPPASEGSPVQTLKSGPLIYCTVQDLDPLPPVYYTEQPK
ncbi:uncharacterized protein LOC142465180 isoform X2 [Ascaphus truei]|uniref:uncharacterized protein LOC142465180 isoform X2 n=1 Tax=Ascaphus truei TaxID=8439 RepID=UPI003F59748E